LLKAHSHRLRLVLAAIDFALSGLIFLLAIWLTGTPSGTADSQIWSLVALGLVACMAWPISLAHLSLYDSRRGQDLSTIVSDLVIAGAASIILLGAAAFLLRLPVSPAFPLLCGATQLVALGSMRFTILGGLRWLRRRGRNFRNVLVVGSGSRAHHVEESILAHPEWGLRLVGFVDDLDVPVGGRIDVEKVHKLIEIPALLREIVVDEVVVACPRSMLSKIAPAVGVFAQVGVPVTLLTDLFGDYLPPPQVTQFGNLVALSFAPVHHSRSRLAVKRAIDVIGASIGLVLAAPVVLIAAIAIRLDSPGPVFFGQVRCGLHGRRFLCWKLRTMDADAETQQEGLAHLNEMDGPVFKIREDPRVTRMGRALRRWSLDELPQLWNVFVGDMSLVGPRPPVPDEVAHYGDSERRRISMRPGITCLWQVNGRNGIGFEEWVKLDLEYIDSWSLSNDFKIMLKTIPAVFRGTGAS
jgi:exopolysaccharide biosynthesis polyprenyl glycosylphosphotransferase